MTPSPLYQAAVAELESVLAPRVVSRSLHEGLALTGSTAAALDMADLERILKGPIYRHLQNSMPADRAKQTISEILSRLNEVDPEARPGQLTPPPLDGQRAALEELKEAIRPFNLYFEWPEVQKLRAQIGLLESEQAAGQEAGNLLREARDQLRLVTQKLEDLLVLQARDVAELTGLLSRVQSLGGPKVRRLENLLGQVREAQAARQLAPAELERARKLLTELRKLVESSVLAERRRTPHEDVGILDVEGEDEERLEVVQDLHESVNARLLVIDLESEAHELTLIEEAFEGVLEHRPGLRLEVARLREKLAEGESVSDRLTPLHDELGDQSAQLREELEDELTATADDAFRLREHTDSSELSRAVRIALSVLESGIPELRDVERIRELHLNARAEAAANRRRESEVKDQQQNRLREQGESLRRLEDDLHRHRQAGATGPSWEEFRDGVTALRAAHQQRELVPDLLASVKRSEARLKGDQGGTAEEPLDKLDRAERVVDVGGSPEPAAVERLLHSALDSQRQEALTEARLLESESAQFADLGLAGYEELLELLHEAQHEAQDLDPGERSREVLSRGWLQLEALRSHVENRLAAMEPRLDSALTSLRRVETLNSVDVEEVRRILGHLDDQRDSFTRISLPLRLELESSLRSAEELLAKLELEFEATRAIAGRLASGNFIDDMLGLFGRSSEGAQERSDHRAETMDGEPLEGALDAATPGAEVRGENPRLDAWIDEYLAEEDVAAAALLDRSGELAAGRMGGTGPQEARGALEGLLANLELLGGELARGAPQIVTLETSGGTIIAGRAPQNRDFLAQLRTPTALSRVLHKLRGELKSSRGVADDGTPLA